MKYLFWIFAVISLGVIGLQQHIEKVGNVSDIWDYDPYTRAIEVAGMHPQIELMKAVADDYSWEVRCEGMSGSMTVLHLVPKLWAWPSSDEELSGELAAIATGTGSPTQKEACDYPSDHFGAVTGDPEFDALAFGTREELEPLVPIAQDCEVQGAQVRPITEAERVYLGTELDDKLLVLGVDPDRGHDHGPIMCALIMANRLLAEAEAAD